MGGPYKDFGQKQAKYFIKRKKFITNLKDDVFGSESYRIDPSS